MKKLKIILGMAVVLAFSISCEKESTMVVDNPEMNIISENDFEKTEIYNDWLLENKDSNSKNNLSARSSFSYQGELESCTSENIEYTGYRSYNIPQDWDYYYFDGEAGDVISILVKRTAPSMDVGATLYFGSISSFELTSVGTNSSSANLMFMARGDDEVPDDFNSCWGDPYIESFTLPYTGRYTLVVWDWLSCDNGLMEYNITTTGLGTDSDDDNIGDDCDNCPDDANENQADLDNDGLGDVCDPHPDSNLSSELSFDGCYPGVSNQFSAPGTTMMDEIDDVIAGVWAMMNNPNKRRNFDPQRQFQSDMSNLINSWYRRYDALVTDAQKFEITKCVRRSRIFDVP